MRRPHEPVDVTVARDQSRTAQITLNCCHRGGAVSDQAAARTAVRAGQVRQGSYRSVWHADLAV
jgi:uncharacterized ParB-like nuclease family protein